MSVRYALLAAAWALALPAHALPSFGEVRAAWKPSDAVVLARDGRELARVRVDRSARRLDWVALADVSPAMRHALVVSEDKRFYQHSGVDWSSVASAAWGNLWNTRTRGASTLTMQLAGLLDADLKAGSGGRSVTQKAGQAWSATWLETRWQKSEILEAYLNLVPFRGEIVGLPALSHVLFGKLPSGLDYTEAAIATALVRGPNASADRVAGRACAIVRAAGRSTPCALVTLATQRALARSRAADPLAASVAPHFARQLVARDQLKAGARVRSTVSLPLQQFAATTLKRHLAELAQRNVQDGAVLVLDNARGDILAWVGSSGAALSNAHQVDYVLASRQAGSTLKPFLYQLAIEQRYLSAASLLDDRPVDLATAGGLYAPQNYSNDFKGLVSVRSALGSSLNIPAVRAITMVGADALRDRLALLGFSTLNEDGDYYGYSLALGAADIRLYDLAHAYRTLARGGQDSRTRWTLAEQSPRPRRVLDAASSFIVSDILSDRAARARTFGLESALSTAYWSAVKTGTSKDMRDNWAVGYSRRYTVAVWVGNAGGEPMWDVSGMHGAAPVWQAVMDRLELGQGRSRPPAMPAGVVRQTVRFTPDVEATRREYFLAGTQRAEIVAETRPQQAPGIVAPVGGSVYAIDPDIPPANQRLMLTARGVPDALWVLNGKRLGRGQRLPWFPWPGRHVLELRSAQGALIERVGFEVRGAVVKDRRAAHIVTSVGRGMGTALHSAQNH
ncbi:penicillin-binding protein 1C [Chitinibacteraceae bacterium HSL-7]